MDRGTARGTDRSCRILPRSHRYRNQHCTYQAIAARCRNDCPTGGGKWYFSDILAFYHMVSHCTLCSTYTCLLHENSYKQDVQPQYWSECASVRKDFPHFPKKLAQTIKTCRQRGAKLIFVRADYRYTHSPWLAQFERLHGGRPDMRSEVPCDPNDDEFAWEDFATPGKLCLDRSLILRYIICCFSMLILGVDIYYRARRVQFSPWVFQYSRTFL